MSAKGNFIELLAAGLPAAVTTALETFKAWGNTLTVYITTTVGGAGTCTLSLESSHDGSNWFDVIDLDSAASWTIDVNAAGKFEFIIPAGLIPGNKYRLSYSCGVAAGTIAIDGISWENPAGSFDLQVGDIHADIDNIEVDTGSLETLVLAEDSSHSSTDPGVMPLAVRNDTAASLADTDGDYAPLQVNADGNVYSIDETAEALLTTIDGDTSDLATLVHVEDTSHTTADPGIEILAVRNDTLASLCDTDGDYAPVQVDADGAVYTVDETAEALLTTIDGDTSDLATLIHIEDTSHTTADPGVQILSVRNDTLATLADTDGDYAPTQVNADGALYSEVVAMPGGLTGHAEDDPHTTADSGVEILAVRNDTLASLCDTDGDYAPVQVDADGAVYTVDETAEALLTTIDGDTSDVASLVHLEDVAHTTADPGVQILSVRNDTLAALCDTDGDYAPTQVDADGALYTVDETAEALLTTIDADTSSLDAKQPALGTAAMAASIPVTLATDDTLTAAANALLTTIDADTGVIAGDTTSLDAKQPALGTAAMAASSPVTIASDDTLTAAANALLTTIDADTSKIPSLGTGVMTGSAPATIATDDTQFGAVGAAADVDGNIHGQLRSIGEAVEAVRVAPLVSPSTAGSGAVDIDTSFGAAWELLSITVHLSAAGTTAENFTIVLDANDGVAYDTTIYSLDLSTDSVTDLVLTPAGDELPRYYESGDELNIDWPNTEDRTYGIRIVYRLL